MSAPLRVRFERDRASPLFVVVDAERGTWLGGYLTERARALAVAEWGWEVEGPRLTPPR